MSFTVSTLYTTVPQLLAGRTLATSDIAEAARKAVLELSEDYMFPALQATGPIVQFTIGQNLYSPNYFLTNPGDQNLEVNKVKSFFMYWDTPTPLTNSTAVNSGINLKYKSVDSIEQILNTLGPPVAWTRFGDQILVAMTPDTAYSVYMRYQKEHPFPNAGTPNAGNDPILLPNSWQDIVEYSTAQRISNELRLYDIANSMHTALFGDPLFQRSGGTQGTPGLIFHRTSQEERDQVTSSKSCRLSMRAPQN